MLDSLKLKNQKLSKLVLKQNNRFTVDELLELAKKENFKCTRKDINSIIYSLREVGAVFGCGNKYEVSEEIRLSLV